MPAPVPASSGQNTASGPSLGYSTPPPVSSELEGMPKKGPAAQSGPCNLHVPAIPAELHTVDAGCVSYYQTGEDGKPVLRDKKRIWLNFSGTEDSYDIGYAPATATVTATVYIKVNLKDQYWINNGAVYMDPSTGKPYSVPFNSDGIRKDRVTRIVDRPGGLGPISGFKKRIEDGLNRGNYSMQPKECPLGRACTCKVKLKLEVELVQIGRCHAEINLFPMATRADSANWGEVEVQWNGRENRYVPINTQNAIAHEAGHLFGWPDEYFLDGGSVYGKYINSQHLVDVKMAQLVDNWQRDTPTNLMGLGVYTEKPEIAKYYMYSFRDWFNKKTGIEWEVLK